MTKKRFHLLLEPEQHRALRQMAQREGRNVSDLTREILLEGIEQRQKIYTQEKDARLQALERAHQVRHAILAKREGVPLNTDIPRLIEELREDQDDQIISRDD